MSYSVENDKQLVFGRTGQLPLAQITPSAKPASGPAERAWARRCNAEVLQLDRLLRYEASLERAFDRTLNQLKRLQRMRKGQPVPATVNVNFSAS
jgi:hypothetical protein